MEIMGSGAPEIQIVAWGLASAGSGAWPQRGAGQRPAIIRLQVLVTDDPPKARRVGSGRKADVPAPPAKKNYNHSVLANKNYRRVAAPDGLKNERK